jgi:thiol-disulfide isomerase/thioredoxin
MKVSDQQLRQIIREEVHKELLVEQSFGNYRNAKLQLKSVVGGRVRDRSFSLNQWLRKHRAQIHVINFWAEWCSNCIKEFPHFKEAINNLNKEGANIKFIPIDQPEAASDLNERSDWPNNRSPNIAWGAGQETQFPASLPLTFILKNGKVVHTKAGAFKTQQEFEDVLYKISGKRPKKRRKEVEPGKFFGQKLPDVAADFASISPGAGEKVDSSRPSFPSCGPVGRRGTLTCKCYKKLPRRQTPAGAVWCLGKKVPNRPGRRWPVKCPKEYPTKREQHAVWTLCRK